MEEYDAIKACDFKCNEETCQYKETCKAQKANKIKINVDKVIPSKKALTKVSSTYGLSGILTFVCDHFLTLNKPNFEEYVNMSSTELPLRDGKVIDFNTLEMRDRTQEDYWSYNLDVMYIKNSEECSIQKFVHDMMLGFCGNDSELFKYLQGIIGLGFTREALRIKKLFVFYGKGNNGKSVVFDWFRKILGQNFVDVNANILMADQGPRAGRATPQLMELPNARLCVFSEPEKEQGRPAMVFSDSTVKKMTGGDPQNIRQLHQAQQKFTMRGLICGHMNERPNMQSVSDQAIVGRVDEFPCMAKFVKNAANNKKCERMLQPNEQDALFSWAARGANRFLENGNLGTLPAAMATAKAEYLQEVDSVSKWLREACEATGNRKFVVKRSQIFDLYKDWCETEGIEAPQKKGAMLKQFKQLASTKAEAIANFNGYWIKDSGGIKVFGLDIKVKRPPPE
jgi:P4 family phage/plasmid primase-like protien